MSSQDAAWCLSLNKDRLDGLTDQACSRWDHSAKGLETIGSNVSRAWKYHQLYLWPAVLISDADAAISKCMCFAGLFGQIIVIKHAWPVYSIHGEYDPRREGWRQILSHPPFCSLGRPSIYVSLPRITSWTNLGYLWILSHIWNLLVFLSFKSRKLCGDAFSFMFGSVTVDPC